MNTTYTARDPCLRNDLKKNSRKVLPCVRTLEVPECEETGP